MNSEQIRKFFADYQVTLKRVEQLEAAMRIKSDWDTWCAALRERAEFFRTEYAHMNALMRSVMPEFAKEEPALDDDAWNQLQISMMDFYRADTHDLALLMELAKILQKHYGHSNNLAAMTDVDLTLAYTNLEFSRILREPYGTRARDYYRKISVLSRNFGAIKEHSVHQAIVISYANLVMSCCVLGSVTMQEAFSMWEEMKELQASDALAATRESEPDVGRLLDIFTERFRTDAYALFDTAEEKIDYIFRLVVARHCTAFLHSLMVSAFAEAILSAIIDKEPTLMVGYHGVTSPEDVQAHRAEILQFAHDAALLHDVGKNSMLEIIETQHRPLTDEEFGIIRSHPNRGGQYLSIDEDLARYVDIARGHHKFYNGKGGYPNDFDNTASPERFMIDIITVCDCLDAATDQYGRNYHQAKTTDEVLAEFKRDAGVRYNPDIVRFILQDSALRDTLREISGSRRLTIYYDTYKHYFM